MVGMVTWLRIPERWAIWFAGCAYLEDGLYGSLAVQCAYLDDDLYGSLAVQCAYLDDGFNGSLAVHT